MTHTNNSREFYRRHLPHWQPRRATFFVTFRLKGSLPRKVIESLREETELEKHTTSKPHATGPLQTDFLKKSGFFGRWDALLDQAGFGQNWLSQTDIAVIVKQALHFRDGREYELYAFCVMPNHVHAVFKPLEKQDMSVSSLSSILHSLKRHTARQANIVLGREGAFWQDESYDHVIRTNAEFLRIIHYVLDNPVKAGLATKWEDWPLTYCKEGLL